MKMRKLAPNIPVFASSREGQEMQRRADEKTGNVSPDAATSVQRNQGRQ